MAKDIYHDSVRIALEKDGWIITDDPFIFRLDRGFISDGLGAERVISAEKNSEKIVVEIKTFVQTSFIHAFHEATGQYDNYLLALEEIAPERLLYLAIPEDIWNGYFRERFIQKVINRKNIRIIIYNPIEDLIVQWKS
jgi:glucose-6-phosphate 1-dehydrogenase